MIAEFYELDHHIFDPATFCDGLDPLFACDELGVVRLPTTNMPSSCGATAWSRAAEMLSSPSHVSGSRAGARGRS